MKEEYSLEQKEEFTNEYINSSLEGNVLALNNYTMQRLYPKSFTRLRGWMQNKIGGESVPEEAAMGLFLYHPRILYDFLDEKEIYLSVAGFRENWVYNILKGEEKYTDSDTISANFKSRILSEKAGIEKAFEILEKL